MKQKTIVLGLAALLLCGCGSTYQATSTLAGASIGGNVGGAIGGLVGSNRHWDGGYRGSAIGTPSGRATCLYSSTKRHPFQCRLPANQEHPFHRRKPEPHHRIGRA